MATYGDIGKNACDLFSKGYPSNNAWKIEVNTRAEDGASFSFVANRTHADLVEAGLTAKFALPDTGLKVNVELKSGNTIKVDLTHSDKFVQGLAVKLAHDNSHKSVFTTTYKNTWGGVEAVATVPADKKKTELELSSVFIKDRYLFGVRNTLSAGDQPAFKSIEAGVQYRQLDYIAAARVTIDGNKQAKFGASYVQKVKTRDLTVGAYACYDPSRDTDTVHLGVASELRTTEKHLWKSKLDSKGIAGVSFQSNLGDGVKLTLATEIDTLQLGKNISGKYGVHIVYDQ